METCLLIHVFLELKMIFLYGDGTSNGKSLYQKYNEKSKGLIQFYDSIIEYIKNGRNGIIKTDNVPSKSITSVKKWFEEGKSDNYIIHQALKLKNRAVVESNPITSTYNRVSQQPEDKKNRTIYYWYCT